MSKPEASNLRFEPVPALPGGGSDLAPGIERWARSAALGELVREFGGEPPRDDLPALLAWLASFSERWDYRRGQERNLVSAPELTAETEALVKDAAAALGLSGGGSVREGAYDHVLILGGLARACMARPLHAARLIEDGRVTAAKVTALGGYRPLQGDELGLVDEIVGEELGDEFGAMDAGIRKAFDLEAPVSQRGEESDVVGASWRVVEYRAADGPAIQVVAAPSTEPGKRRANTPDTFAWFATELAKLEPRQRILVVTTEIYVPYQHADALRLLALPYGVTVDTVGMRPGDVDSRLAQEFAPHHYLQETRSTILALERLLSATAP